MVLSSIIVFAEIPLTPIWPGRGPAASDVLPVQRHPRAVRGPGGRQPPVRRHPDSPGDSQLLRQLSPTGDHGDY